jgi:homoserine kinase type II
MLTMSNIADALRVSWRNEVPWWIQPEVLVKALIIRFKDEIIWLTEHWFKPDSLLCS